MDEIPRWLGWSLGTCVVIMVASELQGRTGIPIPSELSRAAMYGMGGTAAMPVLLFLSCFVLKLLERIPIRRLTGWGFFGGVLCGLLGWNLGLGILFLAYIVNTADVRDPQCFACGHDPKDKQESTSENED